jgi:enoyl-CoA hydratase/carnithine racemase
LTETHIASTCDKQILTITLERPKKLNALTPEMVIALRDALARAARDDVRVVVLRGAGTSFCAGADVHASLGLEDPAAAEAFLSSLADVLAAISSLPKPVIAAIQGHIVGGGAELALEADLRIAADTARLTFPDVALGSTPATAYQLVHHVGKALASEIVLLGTPLPANEMQRVRLVVDVVEAECLWAAAGELAAQLRDRAGSRSLRLAKQGLALPERHDREHDLRANVDAMLECHTAPEQQAYVAGFGDRQRG